MSLQTTLAADALAEGFKSPPQIAKPRVWWHWMGGNVTLKGVREDLEWMHTVGIGGVQNIDASIETATLVQKPIEYLSPEWRQAFRESVDLASGMGLDFDIDGTPGWSLSGGPWVKPHQAMKKLVWSETDVEGGSPFKGRLPEPPNTTGPFQDIPLPHRNGEKVGDRPVHYADAATIAYRAPSAEKSVNIRDAAVTSSAGAVNAARLSDGNLFESISLPFAGNELAWIQFMFAHPQRIQAVSAVIGTIQSHVGLPELEDRESASLEASDDGRTFRRIIALPHTGAAQQTASFAPVTARVFRVVFDRPPSPAMPGEAPATSHRIAELVLHGGARVNRFEDKAGYATRAIVSGDDTPAVAAADVIHRRDIIDLTSRMRRCGLEVPRGGGQERLASLLQDGFVFRMRTHPSILKKDSPRRKRPE